MLAMAKLRKMGSQMSAPETGKRAVLIQPIELIATALECNPSSIVPGSGLDHHPNWDSFGHLAVMVALEKYYGITIDDSTIRQFESFQAIEVLYARLTEGLRKV
jgi:acyl carrier protein